MPCYKPLDAWRTSTGIVFRETRDASGSLKLPCGQCHGCRLERSRQWAVRCLHEAQCHEHSCFVTLTYDDEHVPTSLVYPHFQKFMRRLRKRFGKVRFYMCGEYGEQSFRPHFHACLFGVRFPDLQLWKDSEGIRLYRSEVLEQLWPYGFASVGDVTFESAAYVARYVMKKQTGDRADVHYRRVDVRTGEDVMVESEFSRMSLKPGIGFNWWKRYHGEVFVHDGCVVRGRLVKPPRYYDVLSNRAAKPDLFDPKQFGAFFEQWKFRKALDEVEFQRFEKAMRCVEDSTPERLAVRAKVARARVLLKSRSLL